MIQLQKYQTFLSLLKKEKEKSDNEQIWQIIALAKEQSEDENKYSIKAHKRIIRDGLF